MQYEVWYVMEIVEPVKIIEPADPPLAEEGFTLGKNGGGRRHHWARLLPPRRVGNHGVK